MTNRLWPANAVAGTPQYAGRALRQTTVAPFVPMSNSARPLGALSGVRTGTPASIGSATSTTWTVGPHVGVIDAQTAAEAGPYTYSIDAAVTGAITPADQTNARIDLVYASVLDPAESGTGTPGVSVGYAAGTPSASPAWPTTPSGAMILFQINVPKAGGGAPSVTWIAPTTGPGTPRWVNKSLLDAWWSTAPEGQYATVYNDAPYLNGDYVRSGGAWVPVGRAGLVPITPSFVSGGTASGARVTFTNTAAVAVSGVFTSRFRNYLIKWRIDARTGTGGNSVEIIQLATNGSVATSGYAWRRNVANASAVSTAGGSAQTSWNSFAADANPGTTKQLDVFQPALATPTTVLGKGLEFDTTSGAVTVLDYAGSHLPATAYDGFALTNPTGTITGTLTVYGYNE